MSNSKTIVFDFGRKFVRYGFGGEYYPRGIVENVLTKEFSKESDPVEKTVQFFHKIFSDLCVKSKEYRVLLIENLFLKKSTRDILLTVFIREFQVVSISMQPEFNMAMLASNVMTGIVVDVGETESRAMCFVYGRQIIQSYKSSMIGVCAARLDFKKRLEKQLGREIDMKHATSLFEKTACRKCKNFEKCNDIEVSPIDGVSGQDFIISANDRHSCLSTLVIGESEDGSFIDEMDGIPGLILHSIKACSLDDRVKLSQNIIICGGGAMIPGFASSVCESTGDLCKTEDFVQVMGPVLKSLPEEAMRPHPTPFLPSALVWTGGSLFSQLQSAKKFLNLSQLEELEVHHHQGYKMDGLGEEKQSGGNGSDNNGMNANTRTSSDSVEGTSSSSSSSSSSSAAAAVTAAPPPSFLSMDAEQTEQFALASHPTPSGAEFAATILKSDSVPETTSTATVNVPPAPPSADGAGTGAGADTTSIVPPVPPTVGQEDDHKAAPVNTAGPAKAPYLLQAPDWQSLNAADWCFAGPSPMGELTV